MKNRKFIIAFLFFCAVSATTFAQTHHTGTVETREDYRQGIGWIHTPIGTNWFLQMHAGPQIYFGFEDRLGHFNDRITTTSGLYLGRWIFPMLGFRVGGGYSEYSGFISKASYGAFAPVNIGHGHHQAYLSGYYWDYDKNPALYQQKWNAAYINPDVLINLSFSRTYRPRQIFTTHGYAGVSFFFGLSDGYDGIDGHVDWKNDPNMAADLHVGLIENVRITKNFNIYADLRLLLYEGQFDREVVNTQETGLGLEDYGLSLTFGLNYKFRFMRDSKYLAWYKETLDPDVQTISDIPEHLYTTHGVNVNIITYIDTIYTNDTISEFSQEYEDLLQRKALEYSGLQLDSLKAAFDRDCHEYTLEDILDKQLLPYEMVFFPLDKWEIRSTEEVKIAKMAYIMHAFPGYRFLLIGSADSKTGTVQRNQLLSTNRSDVIYNKLVYEYDVNPDQLKRVYLGGILDFKPYELNRATVIIMEHEKVLEEFQKLKSQGQAGGSQVEF